jgi:hypothetical protein
VWTAIVDSLFTGTGRKPESYLSSSLDQNYPNSGKSYPCIAYKVRRPVRVTLEVFDLFGRKIATLVENKLSSPGRYVEYFDISRYDLEPGLYYYSLMDNER